VDFKEEEDWTDRLSRNAVTNYHNLLRDMPEEVKFYLLRGGSLILKKQVFCVKTNTNFQSYLPLISS
jgi:hypothetical protein